MKRIKSLYFICLISSIILVLFDFYKFDLMIKADGYSLGAELVTNFLVMIPYCLYALLMIFSLFYAIKKYKSIRWKAVIPSIITIITVIVFAVLPYTKGYESLFYSINKNNYNKIIEMINSREILDYQCDSNMYIVPYRMASYTGKMTAETRDGVTKIKFYAYRGFLKSIVIMYASDDSGINQDDFVDYPYTRAKFEFSNLSTIEPKWYTATVP